MTKEQANEVREEIMYYRSVLGAIWIISGQDSDPALMLEEVHKKANKAMERKVVKFKVTGVADGR